MIRRAAVVAACAIVAGCSQPAQPPSGDTQAAATMATAAPAPTAVPSRSQATAPAPSPTSAPPLAAEADKGETGARNVLLEWARALELGDYDRAFAQWGAEAEARSGVTRAAHADYWRKFKTIAIAMPTGTMEGAAGSSYYEAPTTVVGKLRATGKPYRLEGMVTLRRVNDVDGATPDQLHWHIEKVDLKPVS